jgi:hypothetical protein
MRQDLESQLRAALRPVAPREEFTDRLLARVTPPRRDPRIRPMAWWLGASLAASLLLAVGIQQHLAQQRLQQSGLEASRQVVEALRVTSQKLNIAYEAVRSQSALDIEQSGA